MLSTILILWASSCTSFAQNNVWQSPVQDWRHKVQHVVEKCSTSHLTAFQTINDPIGFSTHPLDPITAPKLSALNSTAWEQWYFEGVSSSGGAGLAVGFSRDASYAILGQGNLRVEFDAVWEDGTTFQQVQWMDESKVEVCDDTVVGSWRDVDCDYSFEIAMDQQWARFSIDTPKAKGNFLLTSFNPSRFPDGKVSPDPTASTKLAPLLYITEAIPAGYMDAEFTIEGRPFAMTGIGGHIRLWAPDGWFTIVEGWQVVRAVIGPYTLSTWMFTSRINQGITYTSAFLAKQGRKIFSTTLAEADDLEDYMTFKPTFHGTLHGNLKNKATGYLIELVSPQEDKRWSFSLEHKNIFFELGLSSTGDGLTGLVQTGSGGAVVNGTVETHQGVGISEQVKLHRGNFGDVAFVGAFAKYVAPYVPTAVFSGMKKLTKQLM